MPATRRSRRLSRGAEPGGDPMCTGAGDGSPSDPEPSERSHTSRARVTRSSSRSGRTATQYRAAASEPTINTGPKCPIFLLSHELLTLIWTFLDSRTKMTTTVCFPFPSAISNLTAGPRSQSVSRRWQRLCCESQKLKLKFASRKREATDGALRMIVARFHNLRQFDMMCCYHASDKALEEFCGAQRVLARMESLNMEALPELRDEAVKKLAKNTPRLEELSVCKCQRLTTAALDAVAKDCPALTALNINYNTHCVPQAAPGVDITVWPPKGLSKLLRINLRGCLNLTPDLFENLLKTCDKLELLVTPTHITDHDLTCIGLHCKQLQSLDMSYSYYPTDNGVESVATSCEHLRHFNLEGCQLMTDCAIQALTENLPGLEWLDFSYCLNITDAAVIAIAKKCRAIRTLKMVGLYKVTENSVFHFVRPNTAPQLQHFDLTDCQKISTDSKDAFTLSRPKVNIGNSGPLFRPLIREIEA